MPSPTELQPESHLESASAMPNGGRPITIEVSVRLQAIALPEAEGGYSVLIPALGCATQGETLEAARANLIEVAELFLDDQHDRVKAEAIAVARGE